jgi:hypothetical protein
MRIRQTLIIMSLLAASAMSQDGAGAKNQGGAGTVADLPAELQEALLRDAACEKPADSPAADPAQFLETPITTQDIRGATHAQVGVIAAFQDGCHCRDRNCTTYVYLKNGHGYKLAFSRVFTSLHPMRVFKRGWPSLTGKLQLSDSKAETTVYDWTGSEYQPSLCATLTQLKGQPRPAIARHGCAKGP